jgi:pimeloyl-[acyl-carrier protein] methyl ester esterase
MANAGAKVIALPFPFTILLSLSQILIAAHAAPTCSVLMHIQTTGHGPDIALIHGWAMHGGIFHALAEDLARFCRVHVIDLPGHGFSRADATESMARGFDLHDTAQRLTHLLPPSIWIGWSLGGLVAMRAAIEYPEALSGLGLISASPRFVVADDWSKGVALEVFAQFGADLAQDYRGTLERFLALEVHGDEHAMVCLRELRARLFERGEPATVALNQGLEVLEKTDLRDRLSRIACPNLWIAGSRDRLVPSAAMEWSAQTARGRFHRVARAGHAPFITHRDEVLGCIRALVQEVEIR